jgi:hypothetical protein
MQRYGPAVGDMSKAFSEVFISELTGKVDRCIVEFVNIILGSGLHGWSWAG